MGHARGTLQFVAISFMIITIILGLPNFYHYVRHYCTVILLGIWYTRLKFLLIMIITTVTYLGIWYTRLKFLSILDH